MEPQTRYSVKEKIKIVEFHFASKSIAHTQTQFVRELPERKAPSSPTIYRILHKFKETGNVQDSRAG